MTKLATSFAVLFLGLFAMLIYAETNQSELLPTLSVFVADWIERDSVNEMVVSATGGEDEAHIHVSMAGTIHVIVFAGIGAITLIATILAALLSGNSNTIETKELELTRERWIDRLAKQRQVAGRLVVLAAAATFGTLIWLISTLAPETDDFSQRLDNLSPTVDFLPEYQRSREVEFLTREIVRLNRDILLLRRTPVRRFEQAEGNPIIEATPIESPGSNNTTEDPTEILEPVVSSPSLPEVSTSPTFSIEFLINEETISSLESEVQALMERRDELEIFENGRFSQRQQQNDQILRSADSRTAILADYLKTRETNRPDRDRVALWQTLLSRSSAILVSLIFFAASLNQFRRLDRLHTENVQMHLVETAATSETRLEDIVKLRAALYISEKQAKDGQLNAPSTFLELFRSIFKPLDPNNSGGEKS